MSDDPFQRICEVVGMAVSHSLARQAVLDLLPCVNMTEKQAVQSPEAVAAEITAYLDDLVRNP